MCPHRIFVDSLPRCLFRQLARPLLYKATRLKSSAAAAGAAPSPQIASTEPHRSPQSPPPETLIRPSLSTTEDPTPIEHVVHLAEQEKIPEVFTVASSYVSQNLLAPKLELYDILIACAAGARSDWQKPTAFALLAELKSRGIQPSASIYNSLLRLLAKSPDYVRRTALLEEMRQRWISLTDEAWAWVVLGYLKDMQIEIALDLVHERESKGMPVGNDVYKEVIGKLIELGEADEALKILIKLEGDVGATAWTGALSNERRNRLWHDILLVAARDMHHKPTRYLWRNVRGIDHHPPLFNPSLGLCNMVLNCAARHGDPELAEDVCGHLAESDTKLEEHHYAALVEADANCTPPQITKIFSTLAIMRSAGVSPTKHTARAAIPALTSSHEAADAAAAALPVNADIAAVDLVITAYVRLGDLDTAMKIYTAIPNLTDAKPTTNTFNILLSVSPYELAMQLVAEMRTMSIRPDGFSYGALVRVCIGTQDAFLYLEEMNESGYRLPQKTYERLVMTCVASEDVHRAKLLVKEMEKASYQADRPRKWIEEAEKTFRETSVVHIDET